jgi:phage terminase large subunit
MKIDFNPLLFNNVYWHLRKAFTNLKIRYIWLYGGSSASKTYSVVQLLIVRMLAYRGESTMVLRKYAVDIKDSIYQDFKNIIDEWNLSEYFTIQINFIKCNHTGSFVRFRGLDDSEKVKGISGFNRVVMEEISQFDEVDFKQIRKRLRGKINQQIICIFNPISEEHWIKKHIFDREVLNEIPNTDISGMWVNSVGNMVVMKTNYLNNVFIVGRWEVNAAGKLVQVGGFVDQHTIDDFEKDKADDNAYYQIYGLGNWGKIRTGGEFWKDFKYERNTTSIAWNEELPIFLSWDENINPYLTCLVWQIYTPETIDQMLKEGKPVDIRLVGHAGKKFAIQVDEICLEDPNNRVRNVCDEFVRRYPQLRVKGLFVGGDRTSIKEDTKLEKGENFYTKIMEPLSLYKPTLRMQTVNPSVVQSGGFVNQCYAGRTDVEILINTRCKKSIHDYQYALEDSDGTLKKNKKTHPVTKVSYEEFGHPSDAKRYFITVNFSGEYSVYLKGGRHTIPKVGKNISKNSW